MRAAARNGLAVRALLFYSVGLPYHRGKWRAATLAVDRLSLNYAGFSVEARLGRRWKLSPADYTHRDLFWHGSKDFWDTYHFSRLMPPRSVFFDIGANFGYFAIVLADQVAEAYAFEPNPPTFCLLEENIRLNRLTKVHPLPKTVGENSGRAGIFAPRPDNSGASMVVSGDDVEVTTLDEFCEMRHISRVHALKLDVEGLEEKVLKGARKTIARSRPIMLIEANPPALSGTGCSAGQLISLLKEFKYALYTANRRKLQPLGEAPGRLVNVIAIATDR